MKSCPTCNRQYEDETIRFCLDDGSPLIEQPAPTRLGSNADATLHLPGPTQRIPEARFTQPSTMTSVGFQPSPGAAEEVPAERSGGSNRALVWIIVALIIGASGIAIALIISRGRSTETASTLPTPTPIAAATQTTGASESASPEAKSATPNQVNEQTGKPTPPAKATPPGRPTPEAGAATPEPPRRPTTISGGVLNGKATYLAKPAYPAIAKAANASGTVNVQVTVDEQGNVITASAVSGHPLLRQAAVSAARSSKFSPTMLSGQPVKVTGVIIYNFQTQ